MKKGKPIQRRINTHRIEVNSVNKQGKKLNMSTISNEEWQKWDPWALVHGYILIWFASLTRAIHFGLKRKINYIESLSACTKMI